MDKMLILKIKVNDPSMIQYYLNHRHAYHGDAGIDIYVAEDVIVPPKSLATVVQSYVQLELFDEVKNKSCSFIIVARSSIYKTPLRLSQSICIIDSGFRGELFLFVDNLSNEPYHIRKGDRFFQIVAPDLSPMKLKIVDELSTGSRMHKGLGSSGLSKL